VRYVDRSSGLSLPRPEGRERGRGMQPAVVTKASLDFLRWYWYASWSCTRSEEVGVLRLGLESLEGEEVVLRALVLGQRM